MGTDEIFGRVTDSGDVSLHYSVDGGAVTRLDGVVGFYPVDADLSVQYEHATGIVLSRADAIRLGVEIEPQRKSAPIL